MTSERPADTRVRPVDPVAVERIRTRLERATQAPWLHGEGARRMAERLDLMRRRPRQVIDWWPQAGGSAVLLPKVLPQARIDHLGALASGPTPAWWSADRWRRSARQIAPAQLASGHYEMVWANMLLHHVAQPLSLMRAWHQALATDGFLMFSTLGPGTLRTLRDGYLTLDARPAMAPLVDMHDIGDLLVEAGFADPVMDQEVVRLTWRNAQDALLELRSLGANADPSRAPGLRTPRWKQRLTEMLAQVATQADTGRIELEFELVYGHAIKPQARHAVAPETRIGVDELRRALRKPRTAGEA